MNILVIGSGGREHALAWKCAQAEGIRIDVQLLWGLSGELGMLTGTADQNRRPGLPHKDESFVQVEESEVESGAESRPESGAESGAESPGRTPVPKA